ncbi:MAG: hypothetical protein EA001_01755 [Oscillatoriales cyanobacterium]|nr:MAG: hypothetical protein EA001_01755 [Oscillatoriales cyanobacterium]
MILMEFNDRSLKLLSQASRFQGIWFLELFCSKTIWIESVLIAFATDSFKEKINYLKKLSSHQS